MTKSTGAGGRKSKGVKCRFSRNSLVVSLATPLSFFAVARVEKGEKEGKRMLGVLFSSTLSNVPLVLSPDVGDNSDEKKRGASPPGCLDAITLDLMWITAYIVGLCFIAIFVNVLVILSTGILLWKTDWIDE